MMGKITWIPIAVLALVIGIALGYSSGKQAGYKSGDADGYQRAQAEVKKLEEATANKAAGEAAAAANPFQAVNPLEGVETNPFEKTKKILNPFE